QDEGQDPDEGAPCRSGLSGSRVVAQRVRRAGRLDPVRNQRFPGERRSCQDLLVRHLLRAPEGTAGRAQSQDRRGSAHHAAQGAGVSRIAGAQGPHQRLRGGWVERGGRLMEGSTDGRAEEGGRQRAGGRGGKSAAAFRTISEVAGELDVAQHVLRFWESKFPQVRPLKRGGGRRYYR